MRNVVKIDRMPVATEVTHYNIQPTIELTMGVHERDLGHVSEDVAKILDRFGRPEKSGQWVTYDPRQQGQDKNSWEARSCFPASTCE